MCARQHRQAAHARTAGNSRAGATASNYAVCLPAHAQARATTRWASTGRRWRITSARWRRRGSSPPTPRPTSSRCATLPGQGACAGEHARPPPVNPPSSRTRDCITAACARHARAPQFVCLAFYQKEMALWARARLDAPVRSLCLDADLHPEFKVGWLFNASLPDAVQSSQCYADAGGLPADLRPTGGVLRRSRGGCSPHHEPPARTPSRAGAVVQEGAALGRVCQHVSRHHAGGAAWRYSCVAGQLALRSAQLLRLRHAWCARPDSCQTPPAHPALPLPHRVRSCALPPRPAAAAAP